MSLLTPLCPNLPNNLLNGTPADASQVMADFNTLLAALNTTLNQSSAAGGDQYVGLTTDSRFNGTSVHDALTQLVDRQSLYTDTGTTNALVITPTPAMGALTAGQVFWFKPANTTTSGSATININGLGAVGIANWDGTLLQAGQLVAGSYYMGVTAGPGNPIRVFNPSRTTGSFTGTATGITGGPTGTINYALGTDGFSVFCWLTASIAGTSSATTFTITGIPAIIQTTTSKSIAGRLEDSTSDKLGGYIQTGTAGTWTMLAGLTGASNWTASGTKGLLICGFSFSKD